MKRSALFLAGLALFTNSSETVAQCDPKQQVVVFYLNGIFTNPKTATAKNKLKTVRNLLAGYEVRSAPITTLGPVDIIEAGVQKGTEDWTKFWILYTTAVRGGIDPQNEALELWATAAINSRHRINSYQPDVQSHLAAYNQVLDQGKAVLLLGFSQGSLYASMEYDLLKQSRPDDIGRVGIVEVGAMTDSLPAGAGGLYTTLYEDKVVNLVRYIAGAMEGNYSYVSSTDPVNHIFPTYFVDSPSATISANVSSIATAIGNKACAASCVTSRTIQDGWQQYTRVAGTSINGLNVVRRTDESNNGNTKNDNYYVYNPTSVSKQINLPESPMLSAYMRGGSSAESYLRTDYYVNTCLGYWMPTSPVSGVNIPQVSYSPAIPPRVLMHNDLRWVSDIRTRHEFSMEVACAVTGTNLYYDCGNGVKVEKKYRACIIGQGANIERAVVGGTPALAPGDCRDFRIEFNK